MTASFAHLTLDAARRAAATRLREAGVDTPELDARILLGVVLGLDLTALMAARDRKLNDEEAATLATFIRQRCDGWPVARLTGTKEFWGLELKLDAATLVPRPDTETIVEAALRIARSRDEKALLLADIGTGSGAILLALLSELPQAYGVGTDINPAAARTAQQNAARLGLADRACFVVCDYMAALEGGFDLIVSNPPYIASDVIPSLDIEVRAHDPWLALDGGPDGLAAYRRIVPQAVRLLKPSGALVVEVGHDQADQVAVMMREAGLSQVGIKFDLGRVKRAVFGHIEASRSGIRP